MQMKLTPGLNFTNILQMGWTFNKLLKAQIRKIFVTFYLFLRSSYS